MAVFLSALSSAHADGNDAFALKIRGFTVGAVTLTSRADANSYSVTGVIGNSGLTRLFRKFSYRGSASGAVDGARLLPARYSEVADTGRRSSEALITYRGGVPRLVRYTSPKPAGPDTPDPATQAGTIDPLTAIYALLRNVPRAQACVLDVVIFDGKRRSRIAMSPVTGAGDIPECKGFYERLQGFTPAEVSRHTRFDFVLSYSDAGGDMLAIARVAFNSSYGVATIERR